MAGLCFSQYTGLGNKRKSFLYLFIYLFIFPTRTSDFIIPCFAYCTCTACRTQWRGEEKRSAHLDDSERSRVLQTLWFSGIRGDACVGLQWAENSNNNAMARRLSKPKQCNGTCQSSSCNETAEFVVRLGAPQFIFSARQVF